jgi:hypothetical protein
MFIPDPDFNPSPDPTTATKEREKSCTLYNLSKSWVWDPGSGKKQFRIPDPQHW